MNKIALIGDLIHDIFIYGTCDKLSPEGPLPLIKQHHIVEKDGGAGNVYHNLKSLELEVDFFHAPNDQISKKTRIIVDNSILCRYDDDRISNTHAFQENLLSEDFSNYDYVILSDYNKGALHKITSILQKLSKVNCKVIVDPKQDLRNYRGVWCIKPNKKEFEDFYGELTKESLLKFKKENEHELVIVTLGKDGVMYCYEDGIFELDAISDDVADVTGAGDCFIAALVYALTKNYDIHKAIKIANLGAGISVRHLGTYTLTKSDLIKTVVFTNGCFDILHRGHFELLRKSKELGDYLIVGLNSDASVKRLKGNDRPINNQQDRKQALESIKHIDEVIIFDENTPYELIKKVKPDIITKGGDYKVENVVGSDLTRVVILPFVEGYSTSSIYETLRKG